MTPRRPVVVPAIVTVVGLILIALMVWEPLTAYRPAER